MAQINGHSRDIHKHIFKRNEKKRKERKIFKNSFSIIYLFINLNTLINDNL